MSCVLLTLRSVPSVNSTSTVSPPPLGDASSIEQTLSTVSLCGSSYSSCNSKGSAGMEISMLCPPRDCGGGVECSSSPAVDACARDTSSLELSLSLWYAQKSNAILGVGEDASPFAFAFASAARGPSSFICSSSPGSFMALLLTLCASMNSPRGRNECQC